MASFLNTLQNQRTLYSAARFLIVGMLGTIIDFSLFAILHTQSAHYRSNSISTK